MRWSGGGHDCGLSCWEGVVRVRGEAGVDGEEVALLLAELDLLGVEQGVGGLEDELDACRTGPRAGSRPGRPGCRVGRRTRNGADVGGGQHLGVEPVHAGRRRRRHDLESSGRIATVTAWPTRSVRLASTSTTSPLQSRRIWWRAPSVSTTCRRRSCSDRRMRPPREWRDARRCCAGPRPEACGHRTSRRSGH